MRRSTRLNAMLKAITPCIDDDDVLIDDGVIPFAPTRTVLVRARVRHVGPRQIVEWRTAGQWRASPYIVPQTTAGWDGCPWIALSHY